MSKRFLMPVAGTKVADLFQLQIKSEVVEKKTELKYDKEESAMMKLVAEIRKKKDERRIRDHRNGFVRRAG